MGLLKMKFLAWDKCNSWFTRAGKCLWMSWTIKVAIWLYFCTFISNCEFLHLEIYMGSQSLISRSSIQLLASGKLAQSWNHTEKSLIKLPSVSYKGISIHNHIWVCIPLVESNKLDGITSKSTKTMLGCFTKSQSS